MAEGNIPAASNSIKDLHELIADGMDDDDGRTAFPCREGDPYPEFYRFPFGRIIIPIDSEWPKSAGYTVATTVAIGHPWMGGPNLSDYIPPEPYYPSRQNIATFRRWNINFDPYRPDWQGWRIILMTQCRLPTDLSTIDLPTILRVLDSTPFHGDIWGDEPKCDWRSLGKTLAWLADWLIGGSEYRDMEDADQVGLLIADLFLKTHGLKSHPALGPLYIAGRDYLVNDAGVRRQHLLATLSQFLGLKAGVPETSIVKRLADLLKRAAAGSGSLKVKKRRGRSPKYDPNEVDRVWMDWEAAKVSGSTQREFAEAKGFKLKVLENMFTSRRARLLRRAHE